MNPLQFNPMISHSSTHLATSYLRHEAKAHEPQYEDTLAHKPRKTSANWRIRLAHHLTTWARKLNSELNRTQPTVTHQ